jgi:hypothetical protein
VHSCGASTTRGRLLGCHGRNLFLAGKDDSKKERKGIFVTLKSMAAG